MNMGLTKIEMDYLEVMVEFVPRIARALEKIAEIDRGTTARPEPDLSAWTSEGKTHEQMLKEKMAMHNGFRMPENPPKRRGRPPRVKEEA